MLNVLRPALSRLLTPVADALAHTPVTPNALTITGTVGMTAGALWLFPTGHLFAEFWQRAFSWGSFRSSNPCSVSGPAPAAVKLSPGACGRGLTYKSSRSNNAKC